MERVFIMRKDDPTIQDIVSSINDSHRKKIEDNMDTLMEDLFQQEVMHQAFFGTSYMQMATIKVMEKRGMDTTSIRKGMERV
jgi:formate dehydrogenase maturation protein FdhE